MHCHHLAGQDRYSQHDSTRSDSLRAYLKNQGPGLQNSVSRPGEQYRDSSRLHTPACRCRACRRTSCRSRTASSRRWRRAIRCLSTHRARVAPGLSTGRRLTTYRQAYVVSQLLCSLYAACWTYIFYTQSSSKVFSRLWYYCHHHLEISSALVIVRSQVHYNSP